MKKTCLFVIVCILLPVLLLSCGALTRPMERQTVVELHITGIQEYQNSTAGARVLSDSFKDASLTINIMGDYHAEQTVKLTTETASVSFSGIPVGARIQAAASVTTADGKLTYTGKSAEIIVSAGINTLPVVIDPPDITIDIFDSPQLSMTSSNPSVTGETITGVTADTTITVTVSNAAAFNGAEYTWYLNGEEVVMDVKTEPSWTIKLDGSTPQPLPGTNTVMVVLSRPDGTYRSAAITFTLSI